jgi:hypothetical protein
MPTGTSFEEVDGGVGDDDVGLSKRKQKRHQKQQLLRHASALSCIETDTLPSSLPPSSASAAAKSSSNEGDAATISTDSTDGRDWYATFPPMFDAATDAANPASSRTVRRYSRSISYWQRVPATNDGVLGGFINVASSVG